MVLLQDVPNNGFPFEIKRAESDPYTAMSEEEILQKLEKSRKDAAKGHYKPADSLISDMRERYGL